MKSNSERNTHALCDMMRRLAFILSLLCIPIPLVCRAQTPGPDDGKLHYADVVRIAGHHDQVILWEGLPSDFWEKPSYANELAAKKTFKIGTRTFYAQPIPLKRDEALELSNMVLLHEENFQPWSGLKFCGGFHADYAIEWRLNGVTLAQTLFCFSCHEVEFRVDNRTEIVDQSDAGNKQLFATLHSHRQERPPFRNESSAAH